MGRTIGSRNEGAGFEMHKRRIEAARQQSTAIQGRERTANPNDDANTLQRANVEAFVRDRLTQANGGAPPPEIDEIVRTTLDEIGQMDEDAETFSEAEFDAVFEETEFYAAGESHLLQRDPDLQHNPEVEQMQGDLNAWRNENGLPPIEVDGLFGPETEGAVREFQTANGLPENGIVDINFYSQLYPEAGAQVEGSGAADQAVAGLDELTNPENVPLAGDLIDGNTGDVSPERIQALNNQVLAARTELNALPADHPERARLEGQVQAYEAAASQAIADAGEVSDRVKATIEQVTGQDPASLNDMSEDELREHFGAVAENLNALRGHLRPEQMGPIMERFEANLSNLADEEISGNDREVVAALMDSGFDVSTVSPETQFALLRTSASAHDGDFGDDERGPAERTREIAGAMLLTPEGKAQLDAFAQQVTGDSQNRFIDFLGEEQLSQLPIATLQRLKEGNDGEHDKNEKLDRAIAAAEANAETPIPVTGAY